MRAVFTEGPGGQKTLELRVFDGNGGEPAFGRHFPATRWTNGAPPPVPLHAAAVVRARRQNPQWPGRAP